MDIFWGLLLAAVGATFIRWGRTQSDVGVYRLLVARSRLLWGERVHHFFQVSGGLMIVVGVAMALTR